jgi:hypothetical protein
LTPLAHGVGSRTDLPIPLGLALYGAGAAILLGFAVLLLFWRRPHLGGAGSGRPLPDALAQVVDSAAVRRAAQALALAVAVLVVAAAFAGLADADRNLAPWALYVTFWVGLVPASLLLGPVWRFANPLRLVSAGLRRVLPPPRAEPRPTTLGLWPAAVVLTVFLWFELVLPSRAEPAVVGGFLVGYAVAQLSAAAWFGEEWFARGDAFEVYSSLVARLSPWARRDDGRLVLRNPLANANALPETPGLAAVVVVLLGSTAFDGLSRTGYWQTGPGAGDDTFSGTLGLAAMIALVAVLYLLGTRLSGRPAGRPRGIQPRRYASTVLPIALGYTVAHYFSLLLLDGQRTWILTSNPFGLTGVDLFGTHGNAVDLTAVSPDTIAYVQVGAVVSGHCWASSWPTSGRCGRPPGPGRRTSCRWSASWCCSPSSASACCSDSDGVGEGHAQLPRAPRRRETGRETDRRRRLRRPHRLVRRRSGRRRGERRDRPRRVRRLHRVAPRGGPRRVGGDQGPLCIPLRRLPEGQPRGADPRQAAGQPERPRRDREGRRRPPPAPRPEARELNGAAVPRTG